MSSDQVIGTEGEFLSVPEVAQALGLEHRDVRSMLADRTLLGLRRGERSAPMVPVAFILREGDETPFGDLPTVVPGLRGTLIQLADAGYDDEATARWLFGHNDELGTTPIAALRAAHTHAVRRAAQVLAF